MINLKSDLHVHSSEYSNDSQSNLLENVRAAREAGLTTLGLADHVRHSSKWLSDKAAAIEDARKIGGIEILNGVEAKMLNRVGDLDIPNELYGVDFILIADHQFPSENGPVDPKELRAMILNSQIETKEVLDCLIEATVHAIQNARKLQCSAVLAHPFSLLTKIGLSEIDIDVKSIYELGAAMVSTNTALEINEKWNCPGGEFITALSGLGVKMVAGSDAHTSEDIGRFIGVSAKINSSNPGMLV